VKRVYTIWPSDRDGMPATRAGAWRQDKSWLVIDVTNGVTDAPVVEGPVSRQEACRRALELRAVARQTKKPKINKKKAT